MEYYSLIKKKIMFSEMNSMHREVFIIEMNLVYFNYWFVQSCVKYE